MPEIEQEVHVGINIERIRVGGVPLNWDEQLAAVARAHSDDMSTRGLFQSRHTGRAGAI